VNKDLKRCLLGGVYLAAGIVLMAGVAGVFLLDVHFYTGGGFFGEDSLTEKTQAALLFLSAILFTCGAWLKKERFLPGMLLTAMALLGGVRELDYLFDKVVHGFWKLPTAIIVLWALVMVWRRRKEIFRSFAGEVVRPYWGILCAGFCCVAVFSRLFGMRMNWEKMLEVYWEKVSGSVYDSMAAGGITGSHEGWEQSIGYDWRSMTRSIRRFAEEGTELAGYALLFLAAIGFFVSCLNERREGEE